MKICKVCLTSNILCSGCNRKLDTGEITELDIDVTRTLHSLGFSHDFSVYSSDKQIILVLEKKYIPKIIGRAGRNIKKMSEMLRKDVRVIEKTDERKMIEDILGVPIIGVNVVYSGKQTERIRIDKRFANRLRADTAVLEKIFLKKFELVFE